MSNRVEQIATQFEGLNDQVMATVMACTDEEWRRPTASEGWPIGVVAHHIGMVHGDFARILERLAAGETFSPTSSMDAVHERNARHARDHADVGKPETLDRLHANGAVLAQLLRSFHDEDLDRTAGVFGGRELSVGQVIELIVIGHVREHLASIQGTLAA